MQGWYIAIEKQSSVGRGLFEIEDEEFEITDVSTTVKYSQKELLRHRVWIKDHQIVFYNAGVVQHDGILVQEDDVYILEGEDNGEFIYEIDPQNYKTCSILEGADHITIEMFTCASGIFFEEDIWTYVPMYWLNAKEYQPEIDRDPFDRQNNANVPLLVQAIGDKKIDIHVDEKIDEVCILGSQMHSAELMVVLERPEFEGLQKLICKYVKWYGDIQLVLQSAWHMHTLQYLDMSFSNMNSHCTPNITIKSMNFSFCDLHRIEFQREGYKSIHELFLCGNDNIQNWNTLYQMVNLEILDVRETALEVDMRKISKNLRILRADRMNHFEVQRFSKLQYVEIGGRNIFLEKIEFDRHLYSNVVYFSGENIEQQITPKSESGSLYINNCMIDKQSLQRFLEFKPTKVHMNGVSFSSEITAKNFFNSSLFSQVNTLVIRDVDVSWTVLSASNHMLQVKYLWMDTVEQIEQMYLMGSFCGLQFLCIDTFDEDVEVFLKFQAFPTLKYFMFSDIKESSMRLYSTTTAISNTYFGMIGQIDWLRKDF